MDWISLISSLGFPIVVCGVLAWYVREQTTLYRNDLKELREKHEAESKEFTLALNSNTLAIQKLCDKLDAERRE